MDRKLCIDLINRFLGMMSDEQVRRVFEESNDVYCRGEAVDHRKAGITE